MHLTKINLMAEKYPTAEHYPFNLAILRETPGIELSTPITFFVGENGTGKSTFLEAITVRCGIHIWKGLERARCTNNPYEKALSGFVECEWSDGTVPGSFFGSGVFRDFAVLLDEPETALSPKTQLLFLDLLRSMSEDGHAQFIIATHSPILLACPGAMIYSFDHVPVKRLTYEETDHFKIYRDFIATH
jgi:predicted ATPase